MILLLFCLLLFTYLNAWYHLYLIEEKKRSPNHKVWALYRLTFFALAAYIYSTEWDHILILILLQAAIFWILFDYTLNRMRGLPWNYVGKSAFLDKLFAGKSDLMLLIKIILLFASIILTVILI